MPLNREIIAIDKNQAKENLVMVWIFTIGRDLEDGVNLEAPSLILLCTEFFFCNICGCLKQTVAGASFYFLRL